MTKELACTTFDRRRVLAFSLLIFYHTGTRYARWPYRVKSPRIGEVPPTPE